MIRLFKLFYFAILHFSFAIISLVLFIFGARPSLIKKKLLIGSMVLAMIIVAAKKSEAQNSIVNGSLSKQVLCYETIETSPVFPGGNDSCMKFIKDNMQYPVKRKDKGTVYVGFVVEVDGSLTEVKILKGIGGGCNEEALRIIKMMPKWKPGTRNGKTARVKFSLPVKFTLE